MAYWRRLEVENLLEDPVVSSVEDRGEVGMNIWSAPEGHPDIDSHVTLAYQPSQHFDAAPKDA